VRRLRDLQTVALTSGGQRVDCRVLAVHGGHASLQAVDLRTASHCPEFSAEASILFESAGGLVMLNGHAFRLSELGEFHFGVGDGIQMREPRESPRLAIRLSIAVRTRLKLLAGETTDVGAGGAACSFGVPAEPGEHVNVALALPRGGPVYATAEVVRSRDDACALAFVDLGEQERERILRLVLDQRRALVRRVAARTD
jgi:hypothetical protein